MINLYPYEDMDFRGDPNLPTPMGEPWGVIGMYIVSQCIFVLGLSIGF